MLCNNNSYANPHFKVRNVTTVVVVEICLKLLIVSLLKLFTLYFRRLMIPRTAPDLSLSEIC